MVENNVYLEGVVDCAGRLVVTAKALLDLDNMGLKPVPEQLAELALRLRVQCDTIISHAGKFGDDLPADARKAFHFALGWAEFKFANPDLLGSY
jgi:sulfopyruvate decarboxylase TPP-binding subunit